jgi:hypothetical protein
LKNNASDDVDDADDRITPFSSFSASSLTLSRKCSQCGKEGAELEVAYGEAFGWLHRGACEAAWMAARDLEDIPPYLDRRAGRAVVANSR